jgi:TolB-like protein
MGATYLIRVMRWFQNRYPDDAPQEPNKRPVAVMFFDNESGTAEIDWLREGLADMITPTRLTNKSGRAQLATVSRAARAYRSQGLVKDPA